MLDSSHGIDCSTMSSIGGEVAEEENASDVDLWQFNDEVFGKDLDDIPSLHKHNEMNTPQLDHESHSIAQKRQQHCP